jgi:hypothetical protein
VEYIEVPGMGHALPADVKWIDQAIDLMDAPLATLVQAAPTTRRTAPTTTPAIADAETEAMQLYSLAENYVNNRMMEPARERLEKILKDYPTTQAAAKAKALLARIPAR